MRIACLAWGSLLWKPGPLVLASEWQADGPSLPIEFARESDGGEMATALSPGAADVQVFWARMRTKSLAEAREQLRQREQIPVDRVDGVGHVAHGGAPGPFDARIAAWAAQRALDAVVWTALPPRSRGVEGRMPHPDEVCAYLDALPLDVRAHAEDYVRRTPPSLRTRYRTTIEERLGWTPFAEVESR